MSFDRPWLKPTEYASTKLFQHSFASRLAQLRGDAPTSQYHRERASEYIRSPADNLTIMEANAKARSEFNKYSTYHTRSKQKQESIARRTKAMGKQLYSHFFAAKLHALRKQPSASRIHSDAAINILDDHSDLDLSGIKQKAYTDASQTFEKYEMLKNDIDHII